MSMRYSSTNTDNKSVYINKSLTKSIKSQLNSKQWITIQQKKRLTKHVEICQKYLSVLNIHKNSLLRVFYIMDILLNSLLFQVYAIELYAVNLDSKLHSVENKTLNNIPESKFELLSELRNFRKRAFLPLKRVSIKKRRDEKQLINISSGIDRLTQQLFVLVLEPFIRANPDTYDYDFKKVRRIVEKNLQIRIQKGLKNRKPVYVWNANIRKCFDSISSDWLLKNSSFPSKYRYILKKWLELDYAQLDPVSVKCCGTMIPKKNVISLLLINLKLNGMKNLVHKKISEYEKGMSKSSIKYSPNEKKKMYLLPKLLNKCFKKCDVTINQFFRHACDFVVVCSSIRLLRLIKKAFYVFLKQRNLEIHPNKSRTIFFTLNKSFDFLGHTFIYDNLANFLKNKFLCKNKSKHELNNIHRLIINPSKPAVRYLKIITRILIKNQNIFSCKLLNSRIREWVNHYPLSYTSRALSSLDDLVYKRIAIWLKQKDRKRSLVWLKKWYSLVENLFKRNYLTKHGRIRNYVSSVNSIRQIR